MTPEFKVILVAAAAIAFAYTALYPRIQKKTLSNMMRISLPLSALYLLVVGIAFAGKGIGFSLLIVDVPWWVFALLISMAIETPFFFWFCKKHNVDLSPPDD